jgi:hypothetical protein
MEEGTGDVRACEDGSWLLALEWAGASAEREGEWVGPAGLGCWAEREGFGPVWFFFSYFPFSFLFLFFF